MNADAGMIFVVIRFDVPWPPRTDSILFEVRRESVFLQLKADIRGSLNFTVASPGRQLQHKTQRLAIPGTGWAILSARWDRGVADLQMNNKELLEYDPARDLIQEIRTTEHKPGIEPAWKESTASAACEKWISWRKERFGGARKARRGRRIKTQAELISELRRAAKILTDLTALIGQGHAHLLGHLAAELRALLYWNGRTYHPLLLRLAGHANSSLPIYVIPEREPLPIQDGLASHVNRGEPSITKRNPNQVIVDLQEWLEWEVFKEHASDIEWVRLNVSEVIAGVADTLGAAHYDPDIPISIERLANTRSPMADEVTMVLLTCSSLVIPLCHHVLGQIASQPPNTR